VLAETRQKKTLPNVSGRVREGRRKYIEKVAVSRLVKHNE
jgi:hypothetical protein